MLNPLKLKKEVTVLYTNFRSQQLMTNKEILIQMEEVDFMEKILESLKGVKSLLKGIRRGRIQSYIGSIRSRSKTFSKKDIHSADLKHTLVKEEENIEKLKTVNETLNKFTSNRKLKNTKDKLNNFFNPSLTTRVPKTKNYFNSASNLQKNRRKKLGIGSFDIKATRLSFFNNNSKTKDRNINSRTTREKEIGEFDDSLSQINTNKTTMGVIKNYVLPRITQKNRDNFESSRSNKKISQNLSGIKSIDLDFFSQNKNDVSFSKKELDTSRSKIHHESKGIKTSRRDSNGKNNFGIVKKKSGSNFSQSFYFDRGAYKPKNGGKGGLKHTSEEFSLEDLDVVVEEGKKNTDSKLKLRTNDSKFFKKMLKIGEISTPNFNKKGITSLDVGGRKLKFGEKGRNEVKIKKNISDVNDDFMVKLKNFDPLESMKKKGKRKIEIKKL